jgi:hypothetical protein
MLEVEGGTDVECMRILRHEAGHALDNAYRLHFKRRWREMFGSFARPYPGSYKPKLNSRNYVLHLASWYAQAHPAEDFAETFAVWLTPGSRLRRRYQGWPVLKKLEMVDQLMKEVAGKPPKNKLRTRVEPVSEISRTLGEHYDRKHKDYSFEWPDVYDRDLQRIFVYGPRYASRPSGQLPATCSPRTLPGGCGRHRCSSVHDQSFAAGYDRPLQTAQTETAFSGARGSTSGAWLRWQSTQ